MQIIADTHVHLYDCYDLATALRTLHDSLGRLDGAATRVGLLTDRHDADSFAALDRAPAAGVQVDAASNCSRRISFDDAAGELLLILGRQFVAAERIEVLSLCSDMRLDDGAPAVEIIRRVLDAGGVPVLGWSPGKWYGKRGKVVRRLLDEFEPGLLLLGDTTLRPVGYPRPILYRYAGRRGSRVLSGTDALPCAGEEQHLGRYANLFNGNLAGAAPEIGMRDMLFKPGEFSAAGSRSTPLEVFRRLRRYSGGAHS